MAAVLLTPAMANATATTSHLTLTIASKDRAEAPRTVQLRCEPTGGTHPRAAEACESLLAADGNFDQVGQPHTSAPCPLVLRPVIASAHGTWQGKPLHFDKEFGNSCVATSKLGTVFDF
ncbi:SSI family serine proteinase inhibitor [Saccharopolyspora gloriosae]|uniref:SSI family serine proteinase inhibitor n=1 Tax=Saccharopolyspora gloriosae TaxID=455344 RepID=UPI001FB66880|nr:SSI family serine proteinase inhibitor [Saccharopolyspora gloriosae]